MESSSFIRVGQYKSPLRVLAGIFLRSRETQAERVRRKQEQIDELTRCNQQRQRELADANARIAEQQLELANLRIAATSSLDDRATVAHAAGRGGFGSSRRTGAQLQPLLSSLEISTRLQIPGSIVHAPLRKHGTIGTLFVDGCLSLVGASIWPGSTSGAVDADR